MPLSINLDSSYLPNVNLQRISNVPESALVCFVPVNGKTGAKITAGKNFKDYSNYVAGPNAFSANRYYALGYLTETIDISPEITDYSSIGFNNQKITTITRMDRVSVNFSSLENPYRFLRENQNVFFRLIVSVTTDLQGVMDVYVFPIGKFAEPDFDLKAEFQSYPIKFDVTYNSLDINVTALDIATAAGIVDASKMPTATDKLFISVYNDDNKRINIGGSEILEIATGPTNNPNNGTEANVNVMKIEAGKYYNLVRIAYVYAQSKNAADPLLPNNQ